MRHVKPVRRCWAFFVLGAALAACQLDRDSPTEPVVHLVPPQLADTAGLSTRAEEQRKAASGIGVFHDFRFTDRLPESGITYRHAVVSDAAKTYKPAHYDHGTGLAVADVDGDGRLDIYFVSQVGGNQLWRNAGGGRFEDMTEEAGVALADRVNVTASFADTDNDGDPDLYVTSVRGGNALLENDGRGRFRDITAASGIGHVGHSSGAVFFDVDRDGLLDLFLTNVGRYTNDTLITGGGQPFYEALEDAFQGHLTPERAEQSLLFRNEGGNRFTDVSAAMGLEDLSWSGDASPMDGNDDGWPDLYILNMQGDDEYYENDGGARFVRRSRDVFPRTSWGAMGIKVFDVDNDGRLDIFITDMHSDMSHEVGPEHEREKSEMTWGRAIVGDGATSIWGNSLFHNEGEGRYREVSDAANAEMYWPWGLSAGDLNADGFEDVFITAGMNYPYRYGVNSLKLNDRGRFVDAEFVLGVEPRRQGQVTTPWFELDLDGADRGHQDGAGLEGHVSIWAARASRSSAIFDVDGDGDLDIVTNEFNTEPMVLLSNLSEMRRVRFLQIALRGTRSNRSGLGALVTVTAGGMAHTQVHDGKSGYLSQSLMPLYFGLGDAERIERVEVLWPSGRRQVTEAPVDVNGTITLEEP